MTIAFDVETDPFLATLALHAGTAPDPTTGGNGSGLFATDEEVGLRWFFSSAYADDPEGHRMMPHIGGRRCNLDWHHPQLERLIEVASAWGQFHWVYANALQKGYRMGAAANSDKNTR